MAYPVHSISDGTTTFTFINLEGPIVLAQQSVEVISRPNVPGIDSRIFPSKGLPFQLQSLASESSDTLAMTLYDSYVTFHAVGLCTLIRNGVNYNTSYSQKCKVLAVSNPMIQRITGGAGNISGSHTHLLSATWSLIMEEV